MSAPANNPSTPSESAKEILYDLLSIFGSYAFDTPQSSAEQTQATFQHWCQKLQQAETSISLSEELRHTFSNQRHQEHAHVVELLDDIRSLIWKFIRIFGRDSHESELEDNQMRSKIRELQEALQEKDPNLMRSKSQETLTAISQIQWKREQRQKKRAKTIAKDITELRTELSIVRKQKSQDALTQLYNRGALDQQLKNLSEAALLTKEQMILVILDIDDFKKINDTYGHDCGDAALVNLAQSLIRTFPSRNEFVARYGGEEFCIIIRNETLEEAKNRVQKLIQSVGSTTIEHGNESFQMTISVGIADFSPQQSTADWVHRADQALLEAKRKGKNQLSTEPST